jgi:hypothetical protein
MDPVDLDMLDEYLPEIEYRQDLTISGKIESVIINDYGTMFELDCYKLKILSPNKLQLRIGQDIIINIYRGIYRRRDRNYPQSYLRSINSAGFIDAIQNSLSKTMGYASTDKKNL